GRTRVGKAAIRLTAAYMPAMNHQPGPNETTTTRCPGNTHCYSPAVFAPLRRLQAAWARPVKEGALPRDCVSVGRAMHLRPRSPWGLQCRNSKIGYGF